MRRWHQIDPSDAVREAAVSFCVHPLRAADSLRSLRRRLRAGAGLHRSK
jgi:hypothetical protein